MLKPLGLGNLGLEGFANSGNMQKPQPPQPLMSSMYDKPQQSMMSTPQKQVELSSFQTPIFGGGFGGLRQIFRSSDIDKEIQDMGGIARQQRQTPSPLITSTSPEIDFQAQAQLTPEKQDVLNKLSEIGFDGNELLEIKSSKKITPQQISNFSEKLGFDQNDLKKGFENIGYSISEDIEGPGLRGKITQEGSMGGWGEALMNPIGFITESIDDAVQKIPTSNTDSRGYDFAVNLIPSVLKMGTSTVRAITNPADTAIGLTKLVGTEKGRQGLQQYFIDRYGSLDGLSNYAKTDPAGIVSDLATLVSGGASLAGKGASLAGKVGTASKLTDFASKAGKIAKTADTVGSLGLNIPISEGIQQVGALGKKLQQGQGLEKIVGKGLTYAEKASTVPLENLKGIGKIGKSTISKIKPEYSAEEVIEKITKATPEDLPSVQKGFQEIDVSGIKSFNDLKNKVGGRKQQIYEGQKKLLNDDSRTFGTDSFSKTTEVNGTKVTTNPVNDAMDDLTELYNTTRDKVNLTKINQLKNKLTKGIATLSDINDLAITYGKERSGFSTKSGEPLTSVKPNSYERTRKEIKEVLRGNMLTNASKSLDEVYSNLSDVEFYVDKMVDSVQNLKAKTLKRGLGEKIGGYVVDFLDIITAGGLKGAISRLIPRNAGYKTMNALDVQDFLKTNIKKIENIVDQIDIAKTIKQENQARESLKNFIKGFQSNRKALPSPQTVTPSNLGTAKNPIVGKPGPLSGLGKTQKPNLDDNIEYEKISPIDVIPRKRDGYTTDKGNIEAVVVDRGQQKVKVGGKLYSRHDINIYKKKSEIGNFLKELEIGSLANKERNTDTRKGINQFGDRKSMYVNDTLEDIGIKKSDIKSEDMSEFIDLINTRKFDDAYEKRYNAFKKKYQGKTQKQGDNLSKLPDKPQYTKDFDNPLLRKRSGTSTTNSVEEMRGLKPIGEIKKPTKDLEPLYQEARKYKSAEDWIESYKDNISNEKAELKDTILTWYLQEKGYSKHDIPDILKGDHSEIIKGFSKSKSLGGIDILTKDIKRIDPRTGEERGTKYVIAVDGKHIVGSADGFLDGVISRIGVDKKYRGKGIGSEMMKEIGTKLTPRKSITDVSLAGLKTYAKSLGTTVEEIREEANKTNKKQTKDLEPLYEEARKYKSVDEFYKNIEQLPTSLLRDEDNLSTAIEKGVYNKNRTRKNLTNYGELSPQGTFDSFVNDIKKNGIKEAIKIDIGKDGKIIIGDGSHRLLASEESGIKNVPVEIRSIKNKSNILKQIREEANKTNKKQPVTKDVFLEVYKAVTPGDNKKFSNDYYAFDEESAKQYGNNVTKQKLKVKQIADFTNPNPKISRILLEKSGYPIEFVEKALQQKDSFNNPIYDMLEVPDVIAELKKNGYDSIKFKDFGNSKTNFKRHDTLALLK